MSTCLGASGSRCRALQLRECCTRPPPLPADLWFSTPPLINSVLYASSAPSLLVVDRIECVLL